jgi:hypothetical protein
VDDIEVVELSDIDLDFAVEEAFRQGASQALETTRTDAAKPQDLGALELFQGIGEQDLAVCAARCQSIHAVPGYVLLAPGRLNAKVFFVIEGQLRLYTQTGDKRPMAIADAGHSIGLNSALAMQPMDHSAIVTEISRFLAVDIAAIDELVNVPMPSRATTPRCWQATCVATIVCTSAHTRVAPCDPGMLTS